MTPDEAIQRLEAICEWCSSRQADRYQECVSCIVEKWKQDFNLEHTKRKLNMGTLSKDK
jgi:hypothetical protein